MARFVHLLFLLCTASPAFAGYTAGTTTSGYKNGVILPNIRKLPKLPLPLPKFPLPLPSGHMGGGKKKDDHKSGGGKKDHHKNKGGAYNDPVFLSFHGYRYDFDGNINNMYSIISEQDIQVNAEFIDLLMFQKPGDKKGTFIGAVGFMSNADKVAVRPGFGNRVEVSVNGVGLDLTDMKGATQVSTPDGTVVKLFSRNRDVPDTVQVSTTKLALTLQGGGHHLNLIVDRIAGGLCDVHGVLGQTYQGEEINEHTPQPEFKSTGFRVQGVDDDYVVSALFAADSKFNRFGMAPTKCPKANTKNRHAGTISSRKMML